MHHPAAQHFQPFAVLLITSTSAEGLVNGKRSDGSEFADPPSKKLRRKSCSVPFEVGEADVGINNQTFI